MVNTKYISAWRVKFLPATPLPVGVCGRHVWWARAGSHTDLQGQTAVTAYWKSLQLLLFDCAHVGDCVSGWTGNVGCPRVHTSAAPQSQKAVNALFSSKQSLPFGFTQQSCTARACSTHCCYYRYASGITKRSECDATSWKSLGRNGILGIFRWISLYMIVLIGRPARNTEGPAWLWREQRLCGFTWP